CDVEHGKADAFGSVRRHDGELRLQLVERAASRSFHENVFSGAPRLDSGSKTLAHLVVVCGEAHGQPVLPIGILRVRVRAMMYVHHPAATRVKTERAIGAHGEHRYLED